MVCEAREALAYDEAKAVDLLARTAHADRATGSNIHEGMPYDVRMRWFEAVGAAERQMGVDAFKAAFEAAVNKLDAEKDRC